jgi:zinc-ribbon domain
MAFCSNCGNKLTGNEKFCAQCGSDVSTRSGATTSTAAATAAAAPPLPAQTGFNAPYPGAVPVQGGVGQPPPIQPAGQKKGMMGTVVVVVIVAALGYYYYNKSHRTPNPPASQPVAQPSAQPASKPSAPPASPSTPPGNTNGGGNAALVNQQSFTAQWENQSGMLVLTTAKWSNNSTTNLASAVVQCEQDDNSGTDLSQYRITLTGPTAPNTWSSYTNIHIGAVATNMTKVNCTIVHVKTP